MPVLASRDDCVIDRERGELMSSAFVVRKDGEDADDVVFFAPMYLSDDDLWHILALMNHAYLGGQSRSKKEIDRLRKIEDAALDWHQCRTHGEGVSRHRSTVAALRSAIRENSRPGER